MPLNSVWLKVLNDSNRSWRRGPSDLAVNGMSLYKDIFQLNRPGATMVSLPALPKPLLPPPAQGATGLANDAVLNHCACFLGNDTLLTMLGRETAFPPRPSTSGPL